ncbi:carboxymuconolactone decarboxylase family protein, partial [Actinomadura adrarensis]
LHPGPVAEGRPKALNTLGTFAHHPALAHAFFTFNGHVMRATTLTARQREMIILRTAALVGCPYEWEQHIIQGHDAGLTDRDIARVTFGPDAPFWDPPEAALLRAVDELVAQDRISAETWAELGKDLDTRQLMDLICTVGAYQVLARVMNSFELEVDDDLREY